MHTSKFFEKTQKLALYPTVDNTYFTLEELKEKTKNLQTDKGGNLIVLPVVHFDKVSSIRVNFLPFRHRISIENRNFIKNIGSRYNFLTKITRTDVKIYLKTQNAHGLVLYATNKDEQHGYIRSKRERL